MMFDVWVMESLELENVFSELFRFILKRLMAILLLSLTVVRYSRTKNEAERIVRVEAILRRRRLVPRDGQVPQIREERRSPMGISIISIIKLSSVFHHSP